MWRGEPEDVPLPPTAAKSAETTPMLLLMKTMEEYISTLKSQLDVKDRQLAESQETMREQMRLLTYAGPALSKTTDEVGELKQQLAEKDQQMAKLEKVMVEKVALLMKKQQQVEKERVARPRVVTE
jgi:chromosome segregation ATPase